MPVFGGFLARVATPLQKTPFPFTKTMKNLRQATPRPAAVVTAPNTNAAPVATPPPAARPAAPETTTAAPEAPNVVSPPTPPPPVEVPNRIIGGSIRVRAVAAYVSAPCGIHKRGKEFDLPPDRLRAMGADVVPV